MGRIYKISDVQYRKMLRNEERLAKLKTAIKPLNNILSKIRTDRLKVPKARNVASKLTAE